MKNLTRHRLAFSVLMMCVLMFGVAGVADALTFSDSKSGDYNVVQIGQPFTITFSATLGGDTTKITNTAGRLVSDADTRIDSSGYPVADVVVGAQTKEYRTFSTQPTPPAGGTFILSDNTTSPTTPYHINGSYIVDNNGQDVYIQTGGTRGARARSSLGTPAAQLPIEQRYHYNEEAIGISSDPTSLTLRKSGTTITPTSTVLTVGPTDATASLYEGAEHANRRLGSSTTLTGIATAAGQYTITIADITEDSDLPNPTEDRATSITFTIFVLQNVSDSRSSTIASTAPDGFVDDIAPEFGIVPLSVTLSGTGATTFARVEFEVTRGPGRLYEDKDGDGKADKSASNRLTAFTNNLGNASVANVILMPNRGTSHIRAWVSGNSPDTGIEAIYSYGFSQLKKVSGDRQTGPASSRLEEPFVVQLVDSTGRTTIPGADITFTPSGGSMLVKDPSFPSDLYDGFPTAEEDTAGTVTTDSNGRASVYLVLGTTGDQEVEAQFGTDTSGAVTFTASIGDVATDDRNPTTINILRETDGQRANQYGQLDKPLTVIVRDQYGDRHPGQVVEFEERDGGVVSNPKGTDPGTVPTDITTPTLGNSDATDRRRDIITDASGEASVRYLAAEKSGRQRVTATLQDGSRRSVTFTINGTPSSTSGTGNTGGTPTTSASLTLSVSSLSGEAGAERPVTATVLDENRNRVSGVSVTFSLSTSTGSVSPATDITDNNGRASTTVTLPSTTGGTLTASAPGYGSDTASITVTAPATAEGDADEEEDTASAPAQLFSAGGDDQVGEINSRLDEELAVQVVDRNGDGVAGVSVAFRVTEGSARLSPARTFTNSGGIADVSLIPRGRGTIEVEASVTGLSPVYFTITTGEPPNAIGIVSGNNQSGRPGQALANPFVVVVVDRNEDPVSGVAVTFAVTAGGGSVSPTSAITNNNGRAQTTLTLGDELGDNTVVARVAGLSDRVTFTARTGAEVLVSAAQRPPLYWVDRTNGTLHRLVDEETEDLAPNMKGATNITVDAANGYIYWTAQTAQNKGAIRRAGLNGRGAQTLKAVSSLPMGIAVDGAGGIVYWTNARGNILSMPVAGGKVTNIAKNLSSPGPLALSNGVLYWGEATGSVRKMSLTAKPKTIENLATGLGAPLAITIAKGKVYWVEHGGNNGSGKLQRANLNGTGIQQLKGFPGGVPIGFTIDSSANRIYWTKSGGKIQRSNLAGKFVKDIVTGLPRPGAIAIGTPVADDAPVAQGNNQQTNTQQQNNQQQNNQQPSDTSKYDVTGDGAVNQDDVDQVVLAVAFKSGDMKYDLNGDGVVDAKDITAVVGAVSSAGAAAPSLLTGIDVTQLDVTVLHEQIAVLLASGDRSLAAKQTLAYLQELLTLARPDETVLLANYPNPFNPETWIPYHLSDSTEVRVNIYDAQGTLVRELTLGHQTAGYYTSRSRAAYWDGKNALGERVASGIYFYQLQTDEMSPLRKMVILK